MKISAVRRCCQVILIILLVCVTLSLSSCYGTQSGPYVYDAGAANLALTGSQFAQYSLILFDTSAAGRTLTLPTAVDVVAAASGQAAGTFLVFIVTADGGNPVTVAGNVNTTIKPSAATVKANTSQTLYCIFNNVSSGSQAVTIY